MAQAPVASMGSTSSVGSRGISYGGTVAAIPQVQGISTSASGIRGGITAEDTYARSCGPRKIEVIPGKPEHCHCEDDGTGHCIHCGAELDEFDGGCSNNPCWCPIDFNGAVALFMAILAGAYAIYRVRTRQETIEAV